VTNRSGRSQAAGALHFTIESTKIIRSTTAMPKMKTHSGMKKRVRITGTGKVRREQTGKRHLAEAKPTKRKRRLSGTVEVAPSHVKKAKKLLGI
jgi:large subunit ribosomal protein L35